MYFKQRHEDFIIVGDFNSIINENATKDICIIYNFKNSTNHPTCFNNLENSSCIGLILANKPIFPKYTCFLLSFLNQEPKLFYYRNYKSFSDETKYLRWNYKPYDTTSHEFLIIRSEVDLKAIFSPEELLFSVNE